MNVGTTVWKVFSRAKFEKGLGYMTDRQFNIFNAIKRAYITARNVNELGREEIEALYETQMRKADDDELRRIEDIALLFFAAMFYFGGE